jgi:hypothetical protein
MDLDTLRNVNIIWEYMALGEKAASADCLLVLGSRDDRVALYAKNLADQYVYEHVVLTGGLAHKNDLLRTSWKEATEAEHFAQVMTDDGYKGALLLEINACNTGENARYSYELLKIQGIPVRSLHIVTKPYMERRVKATFDKQWPDTLCRITVSSHHYDSIRSYCNDAQPLSETISIMVGDLQRIIEYPKLGYQSEQVVPKTVIEAFEALQRAGFDEHLIKE